MRFSHLAACIVAAFVLLGATDAPAQTLYGVDQFGLTLHEVDPATGVSTTTIGTLTDATNGISFANCLAMDPTTGTMYLAYQDGGFTNWHIGSVDLGTAVITPVVALGTDRARDATFDGAGNYWVVFGGSAANPHSVNTIDLGTGTVTPQNLTPPTDRNKLAYDQVNDVMYLLGRVAPTTTIQMHSFSPAAPTVLTNIPLSGASLSDFASPPMVYDRPSGIFRTANTSANWRTITRTGVVSDPGSTSGGWGGLAYDQVTTQVPVELSAFTLD